MKSICAIVLVLTIVAMSFPSRANEADADPPGHSKVSEQGAHSPMTREFLHDKILGMLVGSAIGDAMGAPTEMWSRNQIQAQYGYVQDLHTIMREPSPEGTWDLNLRAGATTDDTRWKALMVAYLTGSTVAVRPINPKLDARELAQLLSQRFTAEIQSLRQLNIDDAGPHLIRGVMRLQWLQEWDQVARAYIEGHLDGYTHALNRFYGGEMVCAGLLFSPVLGAYYPGKPEEAYRQTFSVDIFDIGYAKDITALTAAMVAAAIPPDATPSSILAVSSEVDPYGYFESRLIGRQAFRILKQARMIVHEARKAEPSDAEATASEDADPWSNSHLGQTERAQLTSAYNRLERSKQHMPFHAGEIHLVNLTALLFSDFDFRRGLEFVVNFGRDNDTTAAVTGAILGAYRGADNLPQDWVRQTIRMNRKLDIDLEKMADRLAEAIMMR